VEHFTPAEIRYIEDNYQDFLRKLKKKFDEGRIERIEKAFRFANAAHDGIKRKSGEPYIIHPISVAKIVAKDLGLGATSIVSALLHDVVEDTEYRLSDIESMFGERVARIVDGLTKLSGNFDASHAQTLKKLLMTLSDDVRVILIKIADRLHNMRTLDAMPPQKRIKIAGETLFLYSPLAHRLGLYAIKSELEELSFRHKQPEEYEKIQLLLHDQEQKRNYLVNEFIRPIEEKLKTEKIACKVSHRLKTSYSIWQKMQNKSVPFNEVYDILAIRIVIKPEKGIPEKLQCFQVLSMVTDIYNPKPERIRDWITIPKANGYESLHVTVMGPRGNWVEVQIRTKRMDDVAEHGFAAHYRYKDISTFENELDPWIEQIRVLLQSDSSDAFDFLDDFKLNLYDTEINVFTPKGDMFALPQGACVLDFAYEVHTDLGNRCIGAKVNQKLCPLNYELQTGDQIEILTSDSQTPKPEWLKFSVTAKARGNIKNAFKLEKNKHIENGKQLIEEAFLKAKEPLSSNNLKKLAAHYNLNNKDQLYSEAGMGFIDLADLKEIVGKKSRSKLAKFWAISFGGGNKKKNKEDSAEKIDKRETFKLKEEQNQVAFSLAKCCNPIPGDPVVGYLDTDNHVTVHKADCPQIAKFIANQGEKIVKAEWSKFKRQSYLTRLNLEGLDRLGIVNKVTSMISKGNNINMRSVKFDTHEGIFKGDVFLYIHNAEDLNALIASLKTIKGIENVTRIENLNE